MKKILSILFISNIILSCVSDRGNNNQYDDSCFGITVEGYSCNNTSSNSSEYCNIHVKQKNSYYTPSSNRLSKSSRCKSNTKKGLRCKRNTYCNNTKCSSHGGNCY